MSKGRSRSNSHQSQVPGWVWLFTGAVLGAFIMFLVHLSDQSKPTNQDKEDHHSKASKNTDEIRFDFYDVLKKNSVDVPQHSNSSKAERHPDTTYDSEFLLQVASFKSSSDAERLRAELILLNLSAIVEQAQIRNGETWHRVIVGPFTSKSKLASARNTLISNKHEALVLKREVR